MSAEPLLSPNDLIRLDACDLDLRLDESDGAGWPRDIGRRLREWETLPSTSTPDLAWAMMRLDRLRCLRVLAAGLEAVLPPDADPRSMAIVPMLRQSERYSREEWEAAMESVREAWTAAAAAWSDAAAQAREAAREAALAAEAARAAARAARAAARAAWAAARAAEAAWAAATARPGLNIRAILLSAWEQG